MDYDFSEDVAKIWPALMFMAGFLLVVGALLFVLDIQFITRAIAGLIARLTAPPARPRPVRATRLGRIAAAVPAGLARVLAGLGWVLAGLGRVVRWVLGRDARHAVGFLGPALVLLCLGLVYPLIRTVYLSFYDAGSDQFIGIDNYTWIFTNDDTLIMLRNTLLWVVCVPLFSTGFGLLYAVLVDKARGEGIAKSLIFMPMAISLVGASIIWKFIYAYRDPGVEQIGLLNQILVWLGGKPQQFLTSSPGNTFYMIVMLVWVQAGFAMVILSAAIKAIPAEIVEAAKIDGARPWQMFWRVTMPSIRPAVVVVVVTITIGTLKVFDIVRTSTSGLFKSSVLAFEMYNQAFRSYDAGKGSALAVLLFVLVVPIVIYQARQLRKRTETR